MNKKPIKILAVFSLLLVLFFIFTDSGKLLGRYVLYQLNSSWFIKDQTIEDGSWDGINIGDTKLIVFSKVIENTERDYHVDFVSLEDGKVGKLSRLHEDKQRQDLVEHDTWKLHVSGSRSDFVTFYFADNRLIKVHRFKKSIELP